MQGNGRISIDRHRLAFYYGFQHMCTAGKIDPFGLRQGAFQKIGVMGSNLNVLIP